MTKFRTKNKDFKAFASDLGVAGNSMPTQVAGDSTSSNPGINPGTKKKMGRPITGNEQITLRLDPRVREKLVQRVAAELQETGRMTTIQAVINQILARELNIG